jgi:hypothetical protein
MNEDEQRFFILELPYVRNKKAAGATCGVRKLEKCFQRTGAIQGSPAKMKPRTPIINGDLPALKS